MLHLFAEKTMLTVRQEETLTSGSVNVCRVKFDFSEDWAGLTKIAVFRTGEKIVSMLLGENLECVIPGEVLALPGRRLEVGVYGTDTAEQVVLPTIWAYLGKILEGAAPGENARPPTPDLWQQELARKGDSLGYTEAGKLGLFSGEKLLSAVEVSGGGGSAWGVGHGLKVVDGALTVDAVDNFKGDNTLPMTAAGVQASVGNIEALLETI